MLTGSGYGTIFVAGKVLFAGQFAGMVCATSFSIAARAAKLVKITYASVDGAEDGAAAPPIFDAPMADATVVEHHPPVETAAPAPGVFRRAELQTSSGAIKTSGQKHFYMETQTTMVEPGSDGAILVSCACQAIGLLRTTLAATLKKFQSKVTVQNTRVGGAYGGKAFLHLPVAAATCIAALRLNRPVVCQLDRNTDMGSLGHRQPCSSTFTIAMDAASSKIGGLDLAAVVDAGSDVFGNVFATSLNAYAIPGAKLHSSTITTNTPCNSIMRAPGDFQGALFTEAAIELAATTAGVDVQTVQEANLDPICKDVWAALQKGAGVPAKKATTALFNSNNKWRKRGLCVQFAVLSGRTLLYPGAPCTIPPHPEPRGAPVLALVPIACGLALLSHRLNPMPVCPNARPPCRHCMPLKYSITTAGFAQKVIVAVHPDGSVSVNHSGLEVGQGINTKVEQAVVYELSKTAPFGFEMVATVVPKSTTSFATETPTWASGTSESCVFAAEKACTALNKTLSRYKASGDSWTQIVAKAAAAGAMLTATGDKIGAELGQYWVPGCVAFCVTHGVDLNRAPMGHHLCPKSAGCTRALSLSLSHLALALVIFAPSWTPISSMATRWGVLLMMCHLHVRAIR